MKYLIILFGFIFVITPALDRFNIHPYARSTTTAFRYYLSLFCYLFLYITVFVFFLSTPKLLVLFQDFISLSKSDLNQISNFYLFGSSSSNYSVAMLTLVSVVACNAIHNIPILKTVDDKIIRFFHRNAAIPFEARRLSCHLQDVRYSISQEMYELAAKHLVEKGVLGVQQTDIKNSKALSGWMISFSMIKKLDALKADTLFSEFFFDREDQYIRLTNAHNRLTDLAIGIYSLKTQLGDEPEVQAIRLSLSKMEDSFDQVLKDFKADACDFISQAVLSSCYRRNQRLARLRHLGFEIPDHEEIEQLNWDNFVVVFLVLLVVLLGFFTQLQSQEARVAKVLAIPILICCSYIIATITVIWCRKTFRFCRYSKGKYPFGGYTFAAVIATAVASILQIALFALISTENLSFIQSIPNSTENFFQNGSWAFRIMTLVSAFVFALLIDLRFRDNQTKIKSIVFNGSIMAGSLAVAALLVHEILSLYPNWPKPPREIFGLQIEQLHLQIIFAVICGFLIGSIATLIKKPAEYGVTGSEPSSYLDNGENNIDKTSLAQDVRRNELAIVK